MSEERSAEHVGLFRAVSWHRNKCVDVGGRGGRVVLSV